MHLPFSLIVFISSSFSNLTPVLSQDTENEDNNGGKCALYLAPSHIAGAGMGVFAGKSYIRGEEIDKSSTLIVESVIIQSLPAINYVYSSLNSNYAAYLLGAAPMMNHLASPNTERTILVDRNVKMDVQSVSLRPYSVYHGFSFTAKESITAGQEVFGNYGDSSWFEEREIPYNETVSQSAAEDIPGYTLEELQTRGHCLSDAVVRESTIPMAGKGLFTTKFVETGGIAALSAGLLVPHHRIAIEGTSSLLLNYCFVAPGSDVALIPMGHAAMANHGGKKKANVKVVWYNDIYMPGEEGDRGGEGGGAVSQAQHLADADPETLVGREGSAVYFSYQALRPLAAGEELLLDYGSAWEQQWQRYLQVLALWLELHGDGDSRDMDVSLAPQFRHPIHIPEGEEFFPSNFFTSPCVGLDCDRLSVKSHSRQYHQMLLNAKKHSMLTLKIVQEASQQAEDDIYRRSLSILGEEEGGEGCLTSGGSSSYSNSNSVSGGEFVSVYQQVTTVASSIASRVKSLLGLDS